MIKELFEGVDIVYSEDRDRWEVDDENNGITLTRKSLAEAKTAVKAALRSKGKGNFKRFAVWYSGNGRYNLYGGNYRKIEVTSKVENPTYSWDEYWVSEKKPNGGFDRSKVHSDCLYKDTAKNRERIAKINALQKQISALDAKRRKLVDGLESLAVRKIKV